MPLHNIDSGPPGKVWKGKEKEEPGKYSGVSGTKDRVSVQEAMTSKSVQNKRDQDLEGRSGRKVRRIWRLWEKGKMAAKRKKH